MATKAAQNRGMTVGDWLAETIALSARKDLSADGKTNLPSLPMPDLVDLVQTMNGRLTAMESQQSNGLLSRWFGRQPGRQENKAA